MCLDSRMRVGAQIDELLAGHDAGDDLRQFLMDEGLAAGNGDHRCAAFIDGMQRVGDAHASLQHLLRMVDLAAAVAGQIALEQRLQHQHQRITFGTAQPARRAM